LRTGAWPAGIDLLFFGAALIDMALEISPSFSMAQGFR
jgi:hypothetical protein